MRTLASSLITLLALLSATAAERSHWAYRPLSSSPPTRNLKAGQNPIDHFVALKLREKGFEAAPEADKRTLLRRVYFNLIGLPPTPEETRDFLADKSSDAYGRVVDRLLASPRHGERWARHWMDVIHFAETHGHDQDRIRTNAWPYRDYLIASFNADKPYARFVQEQVAGDVLFPEEPQATVAMGFLAAGPWDESSLRDIREDTVDRQIGRYLDRDDVVTTVMQTFTSSTVQCARCHDHKFDPIPQDDYYALQAVFAGIDRANRTYDADPKVSLRRAALRRERERARTDRAWLLSREVEGEIEQFEKTYAATEKRWRTISAETFVSSGGATLTRGSNGVFLASGARPERDVYTVSARPALRKISAVRLEVLAHDSLPKRGPGRQDNGNLHLSEFQVMLFEQGAEGGTELKIASASAGFNQDGWTIKHAMDGNEKTAWGIHPKEGESHQAIFKLKEPVNLKENDALVFVLKQLHGERHLIGSFRLSVTDELSPAIQTILPRELEAVASTPLAQRSEEQRAALAGFVVEQRVERKLAALPKPSLVFAGASDFEPDGSHKPAGSPRMVQVLKRGDIHRPEREAKPGALACVASLSSRFELTNVKDEGARRAALAHWLTEPQNALTWRSIVNRVWHHHFGRGVVETPNDFGKMGPEPSHPELLDWLAIWFRDEARGSLKALHRLIVTSAVYRQACIADKGSTLDSENRLLSRMNRTRLDADQVRDAILQISGSLDLRMGGPSDMQFDLQPGHHVTPKVDYTKFDVNGPHARRRSVYRFLFRTLPDPFMDALDCPAGDQLTPVRNSSVTVQQALAMWNDAFVANYASRFAERLEARSKSLNQQIAYACELVWCRPPTSTELEDLLAYAGQHGLANACRVLLNSNEFIFVN